MPHALEFFKSAKKKKMKGLDKYLTTPPDDGLEDYMEVVVESFTDKFFDEEEDWLMDSTQMETWTMKLFNKDYQPEDVAPVIERAHAIFIKGKEHESGN